VVKPEIYHVTPPVEAHTNQASAENTLEWVRRKSILVALEEHNTKRGHTHPIVARIRPHIRRILYLLEKGLNWLLILLAALYAFDAPVAYLLHMYRLFWVATAAFAWGLAENRALWVAVKYWGKKAGNKKGQ